MKKGGNKEKFLVPGVPLDLLLVAEPQEALADPGREPGAHAVEQPLEGKETDHCDEQDELAEGVHGHLTNLQRGGEKNVIQLHSIKQ